MLPGPEVIKLLSTSSQLSMKYFLLINVKMPTINVRMPTIIVKPRMLFFPLINVKMPTVVGMNMPTVVGMNIYEPEK